MTTRIQPASDADNDSLWPENIGVSLEKPPIALLQEQAEALTRATKGVLKGVVTTDEGTNDWIIYSLFIEAPNLDGYRYRLLSLTNAAQEFYPVHIVYDAIQDYDSSKLDHNAWVEVLRNSSLSDEDQLRNRLRETFSSEASRKLISSLLTQSEAVPNK